MDLYICEKPSQAKDLAAVLNATQRKDGYLESGSTVVTWAVGHLLELDSPDEYGEQYKKWSLETLPITPENWQYHVKKSVSKQYQVIKKLTSKASTIYISTDYDREGEAIARSLLDRLKYKGQVKRVCLTALDTKSIKKALRSIKQGNETVPLYHAALSRQRADWLIGMNITRLYTILCRQSGYNQTLNIGRVLTPTVALVCKRDAEIKDFKPKPYWTLQVQVTASSGTFSANWIAPDECCDDQGRCTNKVVADQLAQALSTSHPASIDNTETKAGRELAPLPYDLTSLQQYASKRWGYTAQETLSAVQALYEKHKATTYPRTDSRYIPESQVDDIPDILAVIKKSDPELVTAVNQADPNRKSRAYNDKKVTAHHAIIPTPSPVNVSAMTEAERNIYDAVCRNFVAQFYPPYEFENTDIRVGGLGHEFQAKGKVPISQGWKVVFSNNDEEDDDPDEQAQLPQVSQGEQVSLDQPAIEDKMTRPAPHFTEATLLAAMENIARFVDEPKLKKILKDSAGIGTPATRAATIEGAVSKGYLDRKKKQLIATRDCSPPVGRGFQLLRPQLAFR